LQLSPAKRAAAGIILAQPRTLLVSATVTAFGRVLDSTPFIMQLADAVTAQLTAKASETEAARLRELFAADTNASAQAVAAANVVAARDTLAAAAAKARLVASWGEELGTRDPEVMIAAFTRGSSLAQLHALPGSAGTAPNLSVVELKSQDGRKHQAEIVGTAPVTDAQIQGIGLIALIGNDRLSVGARLRGELPTVGAPSKLLAVSQSALVYYQGSAWVYVLGEDDTFERRVVSTGSSTDQNVTITSGIEADQQVVISGAQQLLSSELQSGEVEDPD